MEADKIVELLRGAAAFDDAPDEALTELAAAFTKRSFASGDTIVQAGDTGGEFFVLIDGELEVSIPRRGADPEPTGTIKAGDTFGEIASLTGGRRLATINALADGQLLVLAGPTFQGVLHRHPAMAESVLRSLERYQRR